MAGEEELLGFFLFKNNEVFLVFFLLLLLPVFVLRNLINGGGNFSVLQGLDMDFEVENNIFIFFGVFRVVDYSILLRVK